MILSMFNWNLSLQFMRLKEMYKILCNASIFAVAYSVQTQLRRSIPSAAAGVGVSMQCTILTCEENEWMNCID